MRRSAVRSGLFDQRDRATKRRRDSDDGQNPPKEIDKLCEWLTTLDLEYGDEHTVQALNLHRFLQRSGAFNIRPAERLRQLAIYIEEKCAYDDLFLAWRAIDRIYLEAIRLEPNYSYLHSSRALSAHYMHSYTFMTPTQSAKTIQVSLDSATKATLLEPSADNFGIAAECFYHEDALQTLRFADQALELEPKRPWSRLYRAYSLHDLGRWTEAVDAYNEVPLEAFQGVHSWRVDLVHAQQADCLRRSGRTEEAFRAFDNILNRYEKQPSAERNSGMRYVKEAADDWPEFNDRITSIERASTTPGRPMSAADQSTNIP